MIETTLELLRPNIRSLEPYRSARSLRMEGKIFLDANESPWSGLNGEDELNRYPEPQPHSLVLRLAALYGVNPEEILVGRGTDDAIDVLVRAFCEANRDAVLVCPPTYGVYEVSARIQGAAVVKVDCLEQNGFAVDSAAVINAWTPAVKLVFLCSPNNPTGNAIPTKTVREIAAALLGKAVVVVDEAYIEFASTPSFLSEAKKFPNVVLLRTLSKAWALAGARCGVAMGHPDLIRVLQKVRSPYPVSAPSALVAMRALNDRGQAACEERVRKLNAERVKLAEDLCELPLVEKVFPSEGNFLLLRSNNPEEFIRRCLEKGIVVRDRGTDPGLRNCIRVTVGSRNENEQLLSAVAGTEFSLAPNDLHRRARVCRKTRETAIVARVDLDGDGKARVETGIKYFDHMLEQLSKHGGFDLEVEVEGDLEVDEHHTVEDTALVIGECLNRALGDRFGIERYGFLLPMDEAEAKVSLDLSGRPFLAFRGSFPREYVGELPTELVSHFFRSLSDAMKATLHIEVTGENAHHMVESVFKAVGRSLRMAIAKGAKGGLPSTKGTL